MVKVTIGTNTKRETVLLEKTTTIRKALEDAGINFGTGTIYLSGRPLIGDELEKSFEALGADEEATLISVVKSDGGM